MILSRLTRISLPKEEYLLLLGISISIFSSNYSFLIENILRNDTQQLYNWHDLVDVNRMKKIYSAVQKTIPQEHVEEIIELLREIINLRNRIVHSFRITSSTNEQILATKNPDTQQQYEINEEFLKAFIDFNNQLSDRLHDLRGF
ncbi:hypothetical protein CI105_08535 [Candidatus Izimaplasma bacterium ZiA1]|nr:hypothetical protein CI105_08535 [Candidatus Izimaplasma bacterium ZiA1]